MQLDDMICHGPLHLHRWNWQYRAVWTPMKDGTFKLHGIGVADTPYLAIGRAYADALVKGWDPKA